MYRAEICTQGELTALAAELHRAGPQSAFTSPYWLGALFETLAPHVSAEPFGVVVRKAQGGKIAGVLPLALTREGGFDTVRFADFGVTDYVSPLIGPAYPTDAIEVAAFCRALEGALARYDLIRFERLLVALQGRPNPLALHPAAKASRTSGHPIAIAKDVPSHLAGLGAKTRRDVERCRRHVASAGPLKIFRADDDEDVRSAFNRLEAVQSTRWEDRTGTYRLDQPAYASFYRALLARRGSSGFAEVLTLLAGDTFVGSVFCIRSADSVTFLRIASNDELWSRYSPGRLTFLAAFEHFAAQGIRVFDLGIGDYDYKRRLGAVPIRLMDLTVPLSWSGLPISTYLRTKAFIGRQPTLKHLAARIRGRA